MKKIAIMTDSNSGITQSEAKTLGVTVLPMPFMINDETFFEDISLSQEEFYKKLESGANISTSQPSPESVMEIWDQLLNEYDEIVHIPMSSGLSGSYQTAAMLSREDAYENKVFVVNNQRISVIQRQSVLDALDLVQKGKNASETIAEPISPPLAAVVSFIISLILSADSFPSDTASSRFLKGSLNFSKHSLSEYF